MANTKIYSQASNDVVIASHVAKKDGAMASVRKIEKAIVIKGGANVAFSDDSKSQRHSPWVMTEVTDSELEILKANPSFMRKVSRGFISIGKAPQDLKADKSAQITEKQMKAKAPKATPKTGPVES